MDKTNDFICPCAYEAPDFMKKPKKKLKENQPFKIVRRNPETGEYK